MKKFKQRYQFSLHYQEHAEIIVAKLLLIYVEIKLNVLKIVPNVFGLKVHHSIILSKLD